LQLLRALLLVQVAEVELDRSGLFVLIAAAQRNRGRRLGPLCTGTGRDTGLWLLRFLTRRGEEAAQLRRRLLAMVD
jgi:hypothetical protein